GRRRGRPIGFLPAALDGGGAVPGDGSGGGGEPEAGVRDGRATSLAVEGAGVGAARGCSTRRCGARARGGVARAGPGSRREGAGWGGGGGGGRRCRRRRVRGAGGAAGSALVPAWARPADLDPGRGRAAGGWRHGNTRAVARARGPGGRGAAASIGEA